MSRRFEFVGGASAKIRELNQARVDVAVRYGRLGTEGQQQTKTLPSAEAAGRQAEKRVGQ